MHNQLSLVYEATFGRLLPLSYFFSLGFHLGHLRLQLGVLVLYCIIRGLLSGLLTDPCLGSPLDFHRDDVLHCFFYVIFVQV